MYIVINLIIFVIQIALFTQETVALIQAETSESSVPTDTVSTLSIVIPTKCRSLLSNVTLLSSFLPAMRLLSRNMRSREFPLIAAH